jgi:hypothetical protein
MTFNTEEQSEQVYDEQGPVVQENKRLNTHRSDSQVFSTSEPDFRPSSRVLSRPGGKSNDVFNQQEHSPPSRTGKRNNSIPSGEPLNVFHPDPAVVRQTNRRDPNKSSAFDEDMPIKPTGRAHSGKTNHSQFEFGTEEEVVFQSGKRPDPQSNQSQFSLGAAEVEVIQRPTGRRDPNQMSDSVTGQRPSSRVLSAPGGKSNFSFGESVDDARVFGKRINPNSNESQLSFKDDSEARPTGRRDPNQMSDSVTGQRPSSRVLSAPGGKSNFSFGESVDDARVFGKRINPNSNESQLSFKDDSEARPTGRRDPNQMSDSVTGQRPSSRVLSAPGGKSNFSFGQESEVVKNNRRDPNARSEEVEKSFQNGSRGQQTAGGNSSIRFY